MTYKLQIACLRKYDILRRLYYVISSIGRCHWQNQKIRSDIQKVLTNEKLETLLVLPQFLGSYTFVCIFIMYHAFRCPITDVMMLKMMMLMLVVPTKWRVLVMLLLSNM